MEIFTYFIGISLHTAAQSLDTVKKWKFSKVAFSAINLDNWLLSKTLQSLKHGSQQSKDSRYTLYGP